MKNENKKSHILRIILWICIVGYPLINSFLGIDLGDTGYHYYAYERLFSQTEFLSFTSYFTNVIGHIWVSIFGFLGLWGINLLEVILEIVLSIFVYKNISDKLGKTQTLIGLFISICAINTYLNIFNYHQFNVFLLTIILLSEYKAITKNNIFYSCISGFAIALVFFSRTGSITILTSLFLYIVWELYMKPEKFFLIKHLLSLIISTIVGSGLIIILLFSTGQMKYFVNNFFRLRKLANTTGSSYNMNSLLKTFILGNLNALSQGLLFISVFILFLIAYTLFQKKEPFKKHIINLGIGIVFLTISIYIIKYSYNVNPVPNWPQLTTGPSFVIGVLYAITLLCFIYNMFSENGDKHIALLSVISVFLPLYTMAGANTGTKHSVLSLWIIAPIATYTCSQIMFNSHINNCIIDFFNKISISVKSISIILSIISCALGFSVKFVDMCYRTNNFDSIDRTELTYSINNNKTQFLKTTKREADSVNQVLEKLNNIDGDYPLIVFGGSLLFYSLTERDSFVQPWFSNSNYNNEDLIDDIEKSLESNEKLPLVIYCRTNNYYGYDVDSYPVLLESNSKNKYSGKREIFTNFLNSNGYKLTLKNDYYIVFLPSDIASDYDFSYEEYSGYIE